MELSKQFLLNCSHSVPSAKWRLQRAGGGGGGEESIP